MARRRVSVELELDAAKFNAEAKGASATVKQVKNEVQDLDKAALLAQKGVAQLGDKTKHTAGDMAVLKSEIKRVEAELRDLARQYEKTGDAAVLSAFRQKTAELNRMNSVQKTIEKLDAAAKDTDAAQQMSTLREEIVRVENELKKLSAEYERTGSVITATSIRRRTSILNDLKALEKEVARAAPGSSPSVVDAGFFKGLAGPGGFGNFPGKGALIGGLVGLGVAAAPAIGAAVGAAVMGGVGTAGIVGGIVAASKNSGVQRAAADFGASISKEFFASGDAFVAPVQRALAGLKDDFRALDLKDSFAIAAPYIAEVAAGIGGLARNFMPGFNAGLKAAGPVLHEFSNDLPLVGKAFGDMFETIGKGKGNVEGMRLIMGFLAGTIQGTGNTIRFLSDTWDAMVKRLIFASDTLANAPVIGRFFGGLQDSMHNLQDPAERTVAVMQKMGFAASATENPNLAAARSIAGVRSEYEKMGPAAKTVEDTTAGLEAETATYVRRLDDQAKAVDANRQAFDDLMKAQSDYLSQILSSKSAQLAWKQDWLDLAKSVKDNGKTLDTTTEKGLANAQALLTLAGDAQRLRDEMLKSPATAATANSAYLSMMKKLEQFAVKLGLSKQAAHDLLWQLEQFPGTISVGIDIRSGGESHAADKSHGGKAKPPPKPPPDDRTPPHKAVGGQVLPGVPYRINEQGYESVTFPAVGTVHPANLVPWSGGASASAAPVVNVSVRVDPIDGRVRQILITDAKGRGIPEATVRDRYP